MTVENTEKVMYVLAEDRAMVVEPADVAGDTDIAVLAEDRNMIIEPRKRVC